MGYKVIMKKLWCCIWLGLFCPVVIRASWNYGQIDDIVLSFNYVVDNDSIAFKNAKNSAQQIRREYNEGLCRSQLKSIFQGVQKQEKWALKVIDSWGKLPSGLLWGSVTDLGHFDECMSVGHDYREGNENIYMSQYCLASYPISNIISAQNYRNVRMLVNDSEPSSISIGICVPDTCNVTVLNEVFKEFIHKRTNESIEGNIFKEERCTRHTPVILTGIDIFAIILFSSICVLLVLSTVYDIYAEKTNKSKNNLFLAFSVIANSKKLFKLETSKSSDTIACLNGIRCLSMFWIIYLHTSLLTFNMNDIINYKYFFEWIQDYYSIFILNGMFAVDSFFLLSGFLVTFQICKDLDRDKLNILSLYLHRYLRLFPILGAAVLFCVTFLKYTGDGPLWNIATLSMESKCKAFWWSALLHIQTLVNPSDVCLPHTWYLSTDTQLYLLSPLIIVPLWKWGKKFVIVILLLIIASMTYIFVMVIIKQFNLKILQLLNTENEKNLFLYTPLHTRASPWLIGILLAYFIRQRKGRKFKLPIYVVCIGWLSSIVVMAAVIFGPYRAQQLLYIPKLLESAFYESFSRGSWSIALSWIIFACMHGYGSIINSMLSLPIWQPLSRLSYTVYIVHCLIQITRNASIKANINFTNFGCITNFCSDFGLTLIISIAMVLALESPFTALERYLLPRNRPKKTTVNVVALQVDVVETEKEDIKS